MTDTNVATLNQLFKGFKELTYVGVMHSCFDACIAPAKATISRHTLKNYCFSINGVGEIVTISEPFDVNDDPAKAKAYNERMLKSPTATQTACQINGLTIDLDKTAFSLLGELSKVDNIMNMSSGRFDRAARELHAAYQAICDTNTK